MLRDPDFERRVRDALDSDTTANLDDEFMARIDAGTVPLLCMTWVLLDSPKNGGFAEWREDVIEHLVENPSHAVSILAMAPTLLHAWPAAKSAVEGSGPPHAPTFTATARIRPMGSAELTATSTAPQARLAGQRAAVCLLAKLAEVEEPTWQEENRGFVERITTTRAMAKHVASAREKPVVPEPFLSSNDPKGLRDAMNGPVGDALAKRELAKRKGTLEGKRLEKFEAAGTPTAVTSNPISALMEHAQKNHIAHPRFVETPLPCIPPMFSCSVTYQGKIAEGGGRSKREAKTDAARNMIKMLGSA